MKLFVKRFERRSAIIFILGVKNKLIKQIRVPKACLPKGTKTRTFVEITKTEIENFNDGE